MKCENKLIRFVICQGVFLGALILTNPAWATHASISSGTAKTGPITTVSATQLAKGRLVCDLQAELVKFETFSEAELLAFAAADQEVHNLKALRSYLLGVSYGLSDTLTLHASLPYVRRTGIEATEPPDEVDRHGDADGLGDLALHAHHHLFRRIAASFESALVYGLKLPTGATDVRDSHGNRFEQEFQPGSGSIDPFIGAAASGKAGPLDLHVNAQYTLVTEGDQETDLGDRITYNAAMSRRLTGGALPWDVMLEANGIWTAKEEVAGAKSQDSGGNMVFVAPGTRLTVADRVSVYFSLGIPIFQDLNGVQNEAEYRLVAGINGIF